MPKPSPVVDIGLNDILAFNVFCERYPEIADQPRLRWWIFHRRVNGLESSGAVVKRQGRWFVIVPRMKDWLLNGAEQAA